jgi:hypothetical protein
MQRTGRDARTALARRLMLTTGLILVIRYERCLRIGKNSENPRNYVQLGTMPVCVCASMWKPRRGRLRERVGILVCGA